LKGGRKKDLQQRQPFLENGLMPFDMLDCGNLKAQPTLPNGE
jgi:hypothetical protein